MSDTTTLIRMVRGNRLTIGEAEALLAAVVCVTPAVGADRPALWWTAQGRSTPSPPPANPWGRRPAPRPGGQAAP
jgi:hypothetical protein